MKKLASVPVALAVCVTVAWGHEHAAGPSRQDFLEHSYELLEQRQPEKATAFLQLALEHYPLDVELNLLYLDVLREEGLEDLALPSYRERLERYGDEPIILFALGRLAGDDAESRDCYERALAADDDFTPAYCGLAELALRSGDVDAARGELERARKSDRDLWRGYALRGELYLAEGKLEKAREDFERALADGRYAPGVYAALARVYYEMGDAEGAREQYRNALALSDDRGEYFLGLAKAQEALGEVDAARLAYAAAASNACGDLALAVEARKGAGRLAFEAGDFVDAAEHITWAATFATDDAEICAYLGKLYLHVGRPTEAAAEFTRATELEAGKGDYWYLLGLSQAQAGELGSAEESLERAVELLPAESAVEAARVLEAVRARLAESEKKQEE
ncbi:MAG: tetratricopeptide repeat protein [candidate division Zixibacteria bacterium]|nr:tetratricopeptide repeat protein [candidate division Zixibacteria bacterium]